MARRLAGTLHSGAYASARAGIIARAFYPFYQQNFLKIDTISQ